MRVFLKWGFKINIIFYPNFWGPAFWWVTTGDTISTCSLSGEILVGQNAPDCTNAAALGATFGTLSATILRFRLWTVLFSTSTLAVPQSNSSNKRDFFSLIAWVLAMCVTSLSEVKITLTSQTLWKGILTIPSAQYFFGMLSTLNSGLWHSFEDLRQERLNSGRILANKDIIDR